MGQKIRKIAVKSGKPCVNHKTRYDTVECERCHEFFCPDCVVEDWSENFLLQFVGRKRDFIKKDYCILCEKRVVRVRLFGYIALLLLFGLPILLWLLLNLF